MVWLVVALMAGLTASIKLHEPDLLASVPWLSFGRIRTIHLNAVACGWAPMAGLAIALFLLPRLLKTALVGARWAVLGGRRVWNAGLIAGIGSIGAGISDGLEWLEIPWQVDILLVVGGAFVGVPLVLTLVNRKVDHLYVSVWYMGCALFWFRCCSWWPTCRACTSAWSRPPGTGGSATTCWACSTRRWRWLRIYYFLPKIIGQPVRSYGLSLLGFWALAFFYGQVGGHHLVGGPVPGRLITLSIVQSMMMLIPVVAFSINQHQTLRGNFRRLIDSPTLRFITFGGMMYTLSSIQGSFEALRTVSRVAHFTHYTVAHAYLGLYAFVSFAVLRRAVLHRAARDRPRMAVPLDDLHALLARGGRHRHLFCLPEHWRLAAGAGHAGRGAPVHGLGRRDPAVPARPLAGRGADAGGPPVLRDELRLRGLRPRPES